MSSKVSIAAATGVGAVHLAVTDGARSAAFYQDVVGLRPLEAAPGAPLRLGAGGRELVVLHPGASGPVTPRRTGLYHLALVVPSRRDLALAIARIADAGVGQSPTDHVLTKADYLSDPDGNGIEIYTETPEDGVWTFGGPGGFGARDNQGRPRSGRDPIDIEELFSHVLPDDRPEAPLPEGTRMGHVHLHVSKLQDAVDFYEGLVGFDLTGISPEIGMAFLSAGGYHHHLGLNTWSGVGAKPAPDGTAGLRQFTVEVPTAADLEGVAERLAEAGVAIAFEGGELEASDPSSNRVRFVSGANRGRGPSNSGR